MADDDHIDLGYTMGGNEFDDDPYAMGGGQDDDTTDNKNNQFFFALLASLIVGVIIIGLLVMMIQHGTFDGTPIKSGYDWFLTLGPQ